MDKNTQKILKFYNAHPNDLFSMSSVYKIFPNISPKDIIEITNFLCNNGYLRIVSGNLYQSTNKGKTHDKVVFDDWILKNIVSIFALIASIIALCRTF